ncbi:MAG: HAMP domain-containing sensor histidine kinase [Pirellulaceae bacterium]|nr:HAMP domain-containing sensor histidine kinase [Pirellulaceae bacterium]
MMKRPWHYWTVFLVALAIVLPAMTRLTYMAIDLDQAEIGARQQAELEEDISRALWRMEMKLMPILAKEAARPSSAYQPILAGGESLQPTGKDQSSTSPVELSPLLTNRSDYVLLNFEVGPRNNWMSPQSLTGRVCEIACGNGASLEEIQQCTQRLDELKETVEYKSLFDYLPKDPPLLSQISTGQGSSRPQQTSSPRSNLGNNMDFNSLQQQALEDSLPNADRIGQSQSAVNTYANARSATRPRNDLQQRAAALKNYSQKELTVQQADESTLKAVREGVSRPVWIGSHLLFARRVETDDDVRIQGCILDWPKIKRQLLEEVQDLLPNIDIEPISRLEQVNVSRMLAALPAQLVVASPTVPQSVWSPMRISLLIVWICLLVAFVGGGVVLHGVLQLSERRAAFVSAVTHELRTPLTTFRMYSEMLAQDMVPDPERRQTYLKTLQREADRLSHLVENVLSYARLERGPIDRSHERLSVNELLGRMTARLTDRAEQAEMQFVLDVTASDRDVTLETDPAAVEQILFNLVDNACKYASAAGDRRIHLEVHAATSSLRLAIRDDGPGISPRNAHRLFLPFSKAGDDAAGSMPGVGLGLALCRRLARELGGRLELAQGQEHGAMFNLDLPIDII